MSRTSSPTDEGAPAEDLDIDEQWEKFARDGCPDWWLMAKYTSGWLTRNLPYVPFRDRLSSVANLATPAQAAEAGRESAVRSQSAPEVALQQAVQHTAAKGAAAAAPPARSASVDAASMSAVPPVQQPAAANSPSTTVGTPAVPEASSACCILGGTEHAASATHMDTAASCGYPLKGLFSCGAPACINSTTADKPVDQQS